MRTGPDRIVLALILFCLSVAALQIGRTVQISLERPLSGDLRTRHAELRQFEQGRYPRKELLPPEIQASRVNTVYPPNAQPLNWLLAPFRQFPANQIWHTGWNLTATGLLLLFAWRLGAGVSRASGWLLVAAVLAMQSLHLSLRMGPPTPIIAALLLAAMLLWGHGRATAAGILWGLSLLKPSNALMMGFAFLSARGAWASARALAAAAAVVLTLAVLAAAWTGQEVVELLSLTYAPTGLRFTARGGSLVSLLHVAGLPPHWGTKLAFAAGILTMGLLWTRLRHRGEPLLWLAVTGYADRVFFYHYPYDDFLLVFLLLALLSCWLRDRRTASLLLALGVGASLWLPLSRFVGDTPAFCIQLVPWTLGLVRLLRDEREPTPP